MQEEILTFLKRSHILDVFECIEDFIDDIDGIDEFEYTDGIMSVDYEMFYCDEEFNELF